MIQSATARSLRVLVADDEDVIRGLLVDFLAEEGYDVSGACDGLEAVEAFILRRLLSSVEEIVNNGEYLNFKSILLEYTQAEGRGHPRYLVDSEEGPDHQKVFSVEVLIEGDRMGLGRGRSKKEAQQMAAKEALNRLGVS